MLRHAPVTELTKEGGNDRTILLAAQHSWFISTELTVYAVTAETPQLSLTGVPISRYGSGTFDVYTYNNNNVQAALVIEDMDLTPREPPTPSPVELGRIATFERACGSSFQQCKGVLESFGYAADRIEDWRKYACGPRVFGDAVAVYRYDKPYK